MDKDVTTIINYGPNLVGMAGILGTYDLSTIDHDLDALEREIVGAKTPQKPAPAVKAPVEDDFERIAFGSGEFEEESPPAEFPDFAFDSKTSTGKSSQVAPMSLPPDWDSAPTPVTKSKIEDDIDSLFEQDISGDRTQGKPSDDPIERITGSSVSFTPQDRDYISQNDEIEEIAREQRLIWSLRKKLESSDVDVSGIPQVTAATSRKERKIILRMLQMENDGASYVAIFDQVVLSIASAIESAFDGKRNWFGSKPDLTGWSDEVRTKLNRNAVTTSNIVSDAARDNRISPAMRLVIELVSSMFLYARGSNERRNQGSAVARDSRYQAALRSMD